MAVIVRCTPTVHFEEIKNCSLQEFHCELFNFESYSILIENRSLLPKRKHAFFHDPQHLCYNRNCNLISAKSNS